MPGPPGITSSFCLSYVHSLLASRKSQIFPVPVVWKAALWCGEMTDSHFPQFALLTIMYELIVLSVWNNASIRLETKEEAPKSKP